MWVYINIMTCITETPILGQIVKLSFVKNCVQTLILNGVTLTFIREPEYQTVIIELCDQIAMENKRRVSYRV